MRLITALLASPLFAAEPQVHRGLAYAEPKNERQLLDVYAPAEGRKHPVVVWMHGGGWRAGDKSDVQNKPQVFADKSFVLVSINYRLLPKVTIKQMAQDVAKAMDRGRVGVTPFVAIPDLFRHCSKESGIVLTSLAPSAALSSEPVGSLEGRACHLASTSPTAPKALPESKTYRRPW